MQYIFAPWEQYDPREDERRFDARMRQLYEDRVKDQEREDSESHEDMSDYYFFFMTRLGRK